MPTNDTDITYGDADIIRATEPNKTNKDRRQKRTQIESKSRKNAKKLKLDPVIQWGEYNPDFPTSGTAGELELHDFLERLEKVSRFAESRTNAAAQLLDQLRKSSKLEILSQLQSQLSHFPQNTTATSENASLPIRDGYPRRLLYSFLQNLDGEKTWAEVTNTLLDGTKDRYHCINIDFEGPEREIDD